MDPGNPQVVYAATGEDNESGDAEYGQGILQTTDGGASCSLLGQSTLAGRHIGGIAVDRSNSRHLVVASDQGLYESFDQGLTWSRNTSMDALAASGTGGGSTHGVFEVHQDPSDPAKWWASWGDNCGSETSGIATGTSSAGGTTPITCRRASSRPAPVRRCDIILGR